jgi:hypothetical protein
MPHDKTFIIGTHDYRQIEFLKQHLGSDVITIGVNYREPMFPFVLKNYSKKILPVSVAPKILAKTNKPLVDDLLAQNSFGLYYLKLMLEQNQFGLYYLDSTLGPACIIPKESINKFDITIDLEDLLIGKLTAIDNFLDKSSLNIFSSWISEQDPLYKFKLPVNTTYINCVGYNPNAIVTSTTDIPFSDYDKLLIKHYFLKHKITHEIPDTNQQLFELFE